MWNVEYNNLLPSFLFLSFFYFLSLFSCAILGAYQIVALPMLRTVNFSSVVRKVALVHNLIDFLSVIFSFFFCYFIFPVFHHFTGFARDQTKLKTPHKNISPFDNSSLGGETKFSKKFLNENFSFRRHKNEIKIILNRPRKVSSVIHLVIDHFHDSKDEFFSI